MNILFYASKKDGETKEREGAIARAFMSGAQQMGDTVRIVETADIEGVDSWANTAVIVGIKGYSRLLMDTYLEAGKHVIIIDKGYLSREGGTRSKYLRVSIDALQPHAYFRNVPRPEDRLEPFRIVLKPYNMLQRKNIIVAGGSLKYAMWHHLNGVNGVDAATTWASVVIDKLRTRSNRPIIYRPKPSWKDAVPIKGTTYSRPPETIHDILPHAWALVTYGSNAAVDAVIAGVPVFILGDGIAAQFSKDFKEINAPYIPTDKERWEWLKALSYCQFSLSEFENGLAWKVLRPQIDQSLLQ